MTVAGSIAPETGLPLVMSATFRAEPLLELLGGWMRYLDIPARASLATWGQMVQDLLTAGSLLRRNAGINVLLIRLEDWDRAGAAAGELAADGSVIELSIRQFVQALEAAIEGVAGLVCRGRLSARAGLCREVASLDGYVELEARFAAAVRHLSGVYVISSAEILEDCGTAGYYDAFSDKHARLPYAAERLRRDRVRGRPAHPCADVAPPQGDRARLRQHPVDRIVRRGRRGARHD